MGSCTITLKGKGVYKIGSEVVSLSTTSKTVTNSAGEESFNYDTDFSIKRVSPVKLFNDEDSDMPIPIYARDNDEIKDEIADFPNAIFDIYTFKCEAQAFKGNKNIRFATICSYDNSYGDSASEMFANSKLKYARFLDVGTEYCYVSSAYKMFSNCELLEDVIGIKNLHNQNADYIFNKDYKLAKNFGEEEVVQAIKDLGYYNDWYDGLNRTFFWDCPYNGTLPEFLASRITNEDLYTYQKSIDFNPNKLIPQVINTIPLNKKLDTYNYVINDNPDINTGLDFFNYDVDSSTIRLHFDNTDFSTAYSQFVWAEGPNRPADPDPEITITDNYDDKVKGIQNLLYNIKDVWDFCAFKNTVLNKLELDTSVILNGVHNGPKLNDIISPIWDPDDNFRLNITNLDVATYVKKPVNIAERYWIPQHHQETFWRRKVVTETNIGPVFSATINGENWNDYDLGHNLGYGRSVKWTTVTYNDIRDKYTWVRPTQNTYGYWALAPQGQKDYIPMNFTVPDRSYTTNGNYNSGYGAVQYESYYGGGPTGSASTPGASQNNPPITGQRPKTMPYSYNKDVAESYLDWVANWSGDANHPDRTRTIQVPFNRYLNDNDCPPQDISYIFKDVPYIKSINFNRNKISKADELFMNCKNIESAIGSITNQGRLKVESAKHIFDGAFITNPHIDFVVDTLDAESAFENSGVVDPTFFTSWTSVLNGDKLFKNSKVANLKNAVFPEGIQTIAEAFADCENLVDVEGNWLQPNSSMHYQNYTYHLDTNSWTKDWVNPTSKDGCFYFPDSVQDIHSIFKDSGLQSVKELALLRYGNNDNVFDGCHNLTEIENLYLNENPNYGNIFYDTPNQNKDWRIWFPTNIKSSYWKATDIGLDPYKVPNLYCDDGFIVVDNESPDSQVQRRVAYEGVLNPERKFKFNYFSHIHPHTVDNNRWYHEIHDVDVWYK